MVDFACKGCPLVDKKDENASYGCLDGSAFKRSFDAVIGITKLLCTIIIIYYGVSAGL